MPAASRRLVLLTVDDNRVIHEVYALAFEKDLHAPASPRRPGGTGHRALRDRRRGDPRPRHAGPQRPRSARSSAQAEARADGRHRLGHRYVSECAPGSATGVVRQLLAARADPTVAIPQPALVAHRVLLVSLDPGFRAALTVALQPRCRVDSAPRIGVAVEMLRSMMPDLGVVDLRGASRERAADLESLRSSFRRGRRSSSAPPIDSAPCSTRRRAVSKPWSQSRLISANCSPKSRACFRRAAPESRRNGSALRRASRSGA
jgi:hypothetical protein